MTNTLLTLHDPEAARRYYADGLWRADTLYTLLREHAARRPDGFALRDGARRLPGHGPAAGRSALVNAPAGLDSFSSPFECMNVVNDFHSTGSIYGRSAASPCAIDSPSAITPRTSGIFDHFSAQVGVSWVSISMSRWPQIARSSS